ncbi:uncharacterized protein At2g24330-like [Lolium rigidum]|uniref:uncharacterized protein At2g24330-like n=1 Tax=Lolium rigidum TaxID=89674 RepID=UPI001F5CA5DD|nr:uncharacterized protein At2g24330-like [Lolium rigidum]
MADGDAMASASAATPRSPPGPPETPSAQKRRQRGLVSRVWKGIFGGREDVEKLLQALAKEEDALRSRVHRRARASRQNAHNVLALASALEIAAVGYAIMTTRSPDISWQMRAARVLPMFLVPALAALIYSAISSITKWLDNRDQHTLEKLRAERQAKIDELKERTNYYTTQQLIQRYDLDPAAKAAAASVLASKLGADSGLRIFLGDESNMDGSKSNDQHGQTSGLRQRKAAHSGHGSAGQTHASEPSDGSSIYDGNESPTSSDRRTVEHFRGHAGNDGGWLARAAALLVGEDPTQCFALICGNCHMHNGLARKEDFSFITYYCPHCNALNGSRQQEDMVPNSGKETPTDRSYGNSAQPSASHADSGLSSPVARNLPTVEELPAEDPSASDLTTAEKPRADSPAANNLPPAVEIPHDEDTGEKATSDQPAS